MDDLYTGPSQTSSSAASKAASTVSSGSGFDVGALFSNFTLWGVLFILAVFLVILITFSIRKFFYTKKKDTDWQNTVFLEISLPMETAEQAGKEQSQSKQEHDVISIGEQIVQLLGEYSVNPVARWFGKGERFSLEIVNIHQEIRFWVVCSKETAPVLERQIVAIYSKANVVRLQNPSFFLPKSVSYAQEFDLASRYELPFRTYRQMEKDPLNTITNTMSGIAKNEAVAIQLVITPVKNTWQENPRKLALKIKQGQNAEQILNNKFKFWKTVGSVISGIYELFQSDKSDSSSKKRKIDLTGQEMAIQLTPQQEEMVKKLEEKSSKTGFLFTLRVIGSAETSDRAKQLVDQVSPAFQIYEVRPFNGFKKLKTSSTEAVENFILRAPRMNQRNIINSEEINSIWHLPNYLVANSYIKWLSSRKPSIPLGIPGPGDGNVFVGTAKSGNQTKDVYLREQDRFRHIYALGGSGSGKSVFLTNIILQDIQLGNGVCVVDPHGELVDDILLRMPPERANDVILFSPSITDRPLGLNMLETDPLKPEQKTVVIDTLFQIWDKLYDLQKTGGPMFETYMKNAMRLVMSHPESGSTLMEIPKVLADDDYRSFKLAMCDDQEVVDFWEKQAMKAGGEASLENVVPYIVSKLAPFVSNDFIRPMIGQQKSSINFRSAMDNKKIVLVKLEKGLIGETSAYLLGMVIIGNLLLAGMGRNDGLKYNEDGTTSEILKDQRQPFYVYIDEMQNFLFDAIPKALEEIRKYYVGFTLAHQFVKQVIKQGDERIKDSIMANTGSKFIFQCGADDAEYLEKTFSPYLTAADLQKPERYTANSIIMVDGQRTTPFNVAPPAQSKNIDPDLRKKIIQLSTEKYGKTREEVEAEIKERAEKFLF